MDPSTSAAAKTDRETERRMGSHDGRHDIHNSAVSAAAAVDADSVASDVDLRHR